MVKILDGKIITSSLYKNLKDEYQNLVSKKKRKATLVCLLIGDDEASKIYLRNKEKKCNEIGIIQKTINLDINISEKEVINIIKKLNDDKSVDGILLQLPIPKHINYFNLASNISEIKDVDAFNPKNIGNIFYGNMIHSPCTPSGIIEMLNFYNIQIEGKDVVIVGRSNIVGKPLALMLINMGASVLVCNSKTKNLIQKTKDADILIVSVGSANLINKDNIKDGAVIIDVGINRVFDKILGDVDFDDIINNSKASYITPVPGGVGPMTVYYLIKNTIRAFSLNI